MNKRFFSELRRLDRGTSTRFANANLSTPNLPDLDATSTNKAINSLLAQLALQLDDVGNCYRNSDKWELYYNFYGEDNWVSVPYAIQSLNLCMADIESFDVLVPNVVRWLGKMGVPNEELNSRYVDAYKEFTHLIIRECYTKGTFKTHSWHIKVQQS